MSLLGKKYYSYYSLGTSTYHCLKINSFLLFRRDLSISGIDHFNLIAELPKRSKAVMTQVIPYLDFPIEASSGFIPDFPVLYLGSDLGSVERFLCLFLFL